VVQLFTATAADAVQFFDWRAMAGEARRRGWVVGWTGKDIYDFQQKLSHGKCMMYSVFIPQELHTV